MKKFIYSPFPMALIFIICGSILCSGCYTLKQGTTMLGYLNRAIPLEDLLIEDPSNAASEDNRRFALAVMDIRRFAMEELGLNASKNYTSYVELDRNYLAAVVSASAKDSFTRYEWWFPIVGRIPYKGFFNVEDARRERERLERRDLDVWIRGVDAFSTLGWFNDPLYSYMKNYTLYNLAELIIHELVHATVYLKNQSQFNEELAEFIGSEGARLYLESIGYESPDFTESRADQAVFLDFIRGLIAELDIVYTNPVYSREQKLEYKESIIANAKTRFEDNYDSLFVTDNYRGFIDLPINNAYLELFRLYYEGSNWYRDLYRRSGSNLRAYIDAAKTLRGREDPKLELERVLIRS